MNDRDRDEHTEPADGPGSDPPPTSKETADRSLGVIVLVIIVLLAGIGIYAWTTLDDNQTAIDGGQEQTTTEAN